MRTKYRHYIVALIVPIVVAAGKSQSHAQPQRHRLDPAPKELRLSADSVSLPMERYLGWAVVEAFVNGNGPYRFLIDTGAPGVLVRSELVEEMKLTTPSEFAGAGVQIRVAGPGGKGIPATLHQMKSMKLGDSELIELKTIATKMPMPRRIAGVIGMGVFRDCLLTFDYPASKVTLARGKLPPVNGRDILDFTQPRQRGSHPVISVEVCGQPVDFTLDTGSTGWFMFTTEVAAHCSFAYGPVDGPKGRTIDQELDTRVARLDGELKFGRYVVRNPHGVVHREAHDSSLIGSRILEKFAITIDQENLRIRFARTDSSPMTPSAFRVAGFNLQDEDAGFVVWGLMPGSSAEKEGLKDGDIVVEIQGKPASELYGTTSWDKLLEGDQFGIQFRPAGTTDTRDITVSVWELVP